MKPFLYPALLPAGFFLLGTSLGLNLRYLEGGWVFALVVASFFLRKRMLGKGALFFALGLASVGLRSERMGPGSEGPDLRRPITAVVEIAGPWRSTAFGQGAPVRVLEWRQGEHRGTWTEVTWLRIPCRSAA